MNEQVGYQTRASQEQLARTARKNSLQEQLARTACAGHRGWGQTHLELAVQLAPVLGEFLLEFCHVCLHSIYALLAGELARLGGFGLVNQAFVAPLRRC